MLDFSHLKVIGKGDERICYEHPTDPSRCIKVSLRSRAKQTKREIKYFKYLQKNGIPFHHLPNFYGEISSSDYVGMEQERILGEGEHSPVDISVFLTRTLNKKQRVNFWKALEELRDYLYKYNIIPCDLVMSNMLIIDYGDRYKVILIDGIGSAELIPIGQYIKSIGHKKIDRRWDRFVSRRIIPYIIKQHDE